MPMIHTTEFGMVIAIWGQAWIRDAHGHFRALKLGDATVVVPIDFLRLPLIAVVGFLLYAEPFDPMVFVGAAVIFTGTYFSLSRESRRA